MKRAQLMKELDAYEEVVFSEEYLLFEKQAIICQFRGTFFRFENHEKVVTKSLYPGFVKWEHHQPNEGCDVLIQHVFNRNIAQDGFTLEITKDHQIIVESSHLRGWDYAQTLLSQLFQQYGATITLPILKISHTPSFNIRGIIEGFYGKPWTKEDRKDCLKFLHDTKMNTYMYAPKDDALQRHRWRELYDEEMTRHFEELLELSEAYRLDFWYMISPGNDIKYTDPADMKVLKDKLKQLIDLGVTHFGLLLDDIDYELKGENKRRFGSSARAHAFIINDINAYLKTELAVYSLVACPTEYDNDFDSLYLEELNEALDKEVPLFWTGPSTLARRITTDEVTRMANIYQREMIIWDNVPVNDFEQDNQRLFLSPYTNRSKNLNHPDYQVKGIVLNPMAQWELSKLTMHHASRYMWSVASFQPDHAWRETVMAYTKEASLAENLVVFANHQRNRHTHMEREIDVEMSLNHQKTEELTKVLTELEEAVQELEKWDYLPFKEQVSPWFNRVHEEMSLWEAMMANDLTEAAKIKANLDTGNHRIGSNIPLTYYERYVSAVKK